LNQALEQSASTRARSLTEREMFIF